MMKLRRIHLFLAVLAVAACAVPFRVPLRAVATKAIHMVKGNKTVAGRLAEFGTAARNRLAAPYKACAIPYPPKRETLVGLKQEGQLEVWVSANEEDFRRLKTYPIHGQSGVIGPKMAEGDGQVPEGFYAIESLHPNSAFHVALRLNYPNAFDREQGRLDGRTDLGSDIMIHGKAVSTGCLAMGDEAAEELFVLTADVGIKNVRVLLSPVDFRVRGLPAKMPKVPQWTDGLYADIKRELKRLPHATNGPAQGPHSSLHQP